MQDPQSSSNDGNASTDTANVDLKRPLDGDNDKVTHSTNPEEPKRARMESPSADPAEEASTNRETQDQTSQSGSSFPAPPDSALGGYDDDDDESVDEEVLRQILTEAARRGIPLDFLAAQMEHGDDDEEVEYPFAKPPETLEDVADFIKSDKCSSIVLLTGAGMSVASGIPDFRSSNGLYATLDADTLTADEWQKERIRHDPSYCLDQHLFMANPLPCLEVNREFILGVKERKWKATLSHRFVEMLQTKTGGKLTRLYTQNIDGLEDQCEGLSHSQRIAVHGSMDEAVCASCNTQMPFDLFCEKIRCQVRDISGRDPVAPMRSSPIVCGHCGAPHVKPNIVLFRSSLPQDFFRAVPNDTREATLLIIIGTSLGVAPANSLVWRVPQSCMRLLINRDPVGWHLGFNPERSERDFFGQGTCEEVCAKLMKHLGWLNDLKPLLDRNEFPADSAELLRRYLNEDKEKSSGEVNQEPLSEERSGEKVAESTPL